VIATIQPMIPTIEITTIAMTGSRFGSMWHPNRARPGSVLDHGLECLDSYMNGIQFQGPIH
jgi:hypothetical protein